MPNARIADQDPLSKVNPFRVMTVMARAQQLESQGRRIVHMEVGEPDFSSAQPIIEAGKRAYNMPSITKTIPNATMKSIIAEP
jgi:aspartate/methionine/tyrosine aminotransferase